MNNALLADQWKHAVEKLENRFGQGLDMQGILFLIGLNELGKGKLRLTKDQKIEVLHIAVCRLLEPFGYYRFLGLDQDGWPHYEQASPIPELKPMEQERLMKEAVLTYIQEW